MGKDDREMDKFALSVFEAQMGSIFKLAGDADFEIDLALISAAGMPAAHSLAPSESGRPFSLLFLGPADRTFEQGIRTLSHPVMGELEIFLVPMQPDDEGPLYEAVFT